jgi:ribose/xylose/arabinose/galactoside ABC-type transport system permease subunit
LAMFFVLRGFKLGFSKKIIDNISVGRIDEGHGYDFFVKIFGSTWGRNDHVWDLRDGVFSVLVIGGITLLVLAVYEYSFQRRGTFNPMGLVAFLAGIAGAGIGLVVLHSTDGVPANWVAGIIFAVSGIVSYVGLGVWRYEPQQAGEVNLDGTHVRLMIAGVASIFLGMFAAWGLDLESQQIILDLVGWASWPIVIAVGAVGGWLALRREGEHIRSSREAMVQGIIRVGWIALISAFGTYAFLYMTTEQGLRAILFAGLTIVGVLLLGSAAIQAGRISPATRTVVLLVTSASVVVLAFFVRWQSSTPKFRTEAFTVLLVGALMVGCWGLVSGRFKQRRRSDAPADHLATILSVVGLAAVVSGVLIRLLFTTQTEIDNGIPPAQFRVEFLWFVGVTILATLVLGKTKFGSWIFAVGGNKQAARQIGVPAARTKTQLFMIVTVAAWLVGLLLAFRLNTIQSATGNGLEFEYIIAAVVGGTLLTGGYGSAFGAAIGAFIMAMARQGIPSARWNSDWRFAFLGVILLTAVIANNQIRSRAEASR